MSFKSALVLFLAIGAVVAKDYCKDMKCQKKPHVACNNPTTKGWGPACPPDRKAINLTPELKARILDIHNTKRNQQAAGQTPNYGPAARMGTLSWDDGLAKMAEYNARSCIYGHDKCRNTDKWPSVGQNIANAGGVTDDKELVEMMVPLWFDKENQNGGLYGWMDMINNFQGITGSGDDSTEVGHFTQFIWQDAIVVGCAGSKYTDAGGQQAILVCNYGYGNMPGQYIYEAGPSASKCKTGPNPKYSSLCSESEDFMPEMMHRSGWDLKPDVGPGGRYTLPGGCDDDPQCRKVKADPTKYIDFGFNTKKADPATADVKITVGPDGNVQFAGPPGCDKQCLLNSKGYKDFMANHPEYGK